MISNEGIEHIKNIIVDVFKTKLFRNSPDIVSTDIHIQPLLNDEAVCIYDDNDTLLQSVRCGWLCDLDRENFYDEFLKISQLSIRALKDEKFFNGLNILQPFSFVLIDENRETVSDIDIVDEDTIILDDELLKGWEDELDSFIDNLLKE